MARKRVAVKVCDRCPLNKQVKATRTETFSLGGMHWKIDLCEAHGEALERDLWAWGRLAEEVEQPKVFTREYVSAATKAAELRAKQAAPRPEPAPERAPQEPLPLRFLPHGAVEAGEYKFTAHALERLEEREVPMVAALQAAVHPLVRRPGREPGLLVHERDNTKVVVNPSTRTILTVAQLHPERKAN